MNLKTIVTLNAILVSIFGLGFLLAAGFFAFEKNESLSANEAYAR